MGHCLHWSLPCNTLWNGYHQFSDVNILIWLISLFCWVFHLLPLLDLVDTDQPLLLPPLSRPWFPSSPSASWCPQLAPSLRASSLYTFLVQGSTTIAPLNHLLFLRVWPILSSASKPQHVVAVFAYSAISTLPGSHLLIFQDLASCHFLKEAFLDCPGLG